MAGTKLTVFLEVRSRKPVRFWEQIMSADKYPRIFSRQMKAIVYLLKTGSLGNAIRESSLAQPLWVMSHYTMLCKYGKQTRDCWGVLI